MQEHNSTEKNSSTSNTITENNHLQGQLLIAMPGLDDPYFKQSVTLICQHSAEGCFGLTINKPMKVSIDEVLQQLQITSSELPSTIEKPIASMNTLRGGPVQLEQGFIIHDSDQLWENTFAISDGLSVTASQDILEDIAKGNGPENYVLTLGFASWEAGQIEDEILNNSWLNCPVDKKIIFDTPFEKRWLGSADLLGIDMNTMSGISGHD